jgi:valyl-tRNA synthetase
VPGRILERHYPNDVLISGFDILFFWDARMIMQGLHFMKEVPFKTLYLHGLVRAADGQKMSKSKGNTVDPLGLIDRFGADALRFTMAAMESQGRDVKLDERRVEGYRNFATKLWNATRFAQANGIGASQTLEPPPASLPVNRWILGETIKTVQKLDLALADLRYDEAAHTIYHFVWDRFCDWYLELIKPELQSPTGELEVKFDWQRRDESRKVAGWVLDQVLVMLHPFMPFITEELWHALGDRPYDLIVAKWPIADAREIDPDAAREIEWVIKLISDVRSARTDLNIPPSSKPAAVFIPTTQEGGRLFSGNTAPIARSARLVTDIGPVLNEAELKQWVVEELGASIQVASEGGVTAIKVEGLIDLDAERARLAKAIAAAEKERDGLAGRLGNPSFVERAKPEAVEKARADHAEKSAEAERLAAALTRLG